MEEVSRPTWDHVWMQVADTIAKRSLCTGAQVGFVLVSSDQSVLSVTYNGPPPGYKVEGRCDLWCPRAQNIGGRTGDYSNCPSVHAEVNGVSRADHSHIKGATGYSTSSSCMGCAKTLASAGVSRLVHRVNTTQLHRTPEVSEDFLRKSGVEVVRWTF